MNEALLIAKKAEIEAFVSFREAMIVKNKEREAEGMAFTYDEVAFDKNGNHLVTIYNDIIKSVMADNGYETVNGAHPIGFKKGEK